MHKRVLFAGLFHETNTFVQEPTSLADFTVLRGEEILRCAGDSSPLGGALEAAGQWGWTVLPVVDFRASPGGVIEDEVVETFWREFHDKAERELARGLDAIYLVLHGAMVSRSILDVEGEILERIRALSGAANLPVFGVFDLHANFTRRMADCTNCLVAYRENPHTDAREAALRAANLLERSFATGRIPRTFWTHPPIMWPPTGTGSATEPMLSLEKRAREIEAENEDIWAVNVVAGFSFADTPDTGVTFSIVTSGSPLDAESHLNHLSELAWQNKEKGYVVEPSIESVLPLIIASDSAATRDVGPLPPIPHSALHTPHFTQAPAEQGPTVLVEPSDNIGAGAPGDGTAVLRALIAHKFKSAAVTINDPDAIHRLSVAAIGTTVALRIGGKGSALDPGPLELAVQLVSRSEGKFGLEDKQSHLASMAGDSFDMGPCAVVRHEGVLILLTSRRTPPFDLGQWRSQGIEPKQLSVIVVKAAVAHRRAYDPIAARMFWVDTPGPCRSNLQVLPYRRVRRPIFPLDD